MTMFVTILLVGIGSYALRAVPLLLIDRVRISPATQELLSDAVLAAMTALLVVSLIHVLTAAPAQGVTPAAGWVGVLAGLTAATLRQSMGRVLIIGMIGYAATALLVAAW